MNSHKSARLTIEGRKLLIERIAVMGLRVAAEAAGGSPRTWRRLGVRARCHRRSLPDRPRADALRPEERLGDRLPRGLGGALRGAWREDQRLLTDNGPAYRSKLCNKSCQALGIKHTYTRPYTRRPTARPSASSRLACANGRRKTVAKQRGTNLLVARALLVSTPLEHAVIGLESERRAGPQFSAYEATLHTISVQRLNRRLTGAARRCHFGSFTLDLLDTLSLMPLMQISSGRVFPATDGEALLYAALRADVTLDHSCRTGRCSTCKSKVRAGSIVATRQELGLSEEERCAGWILNCVRSETSDIELDVEDLGDLRLPHPQTLPCGITSALSIHRTSS